VSVVAPMSSEIAISIRLSATRRMHDDDIMPGDVRTVKYVEQSLPEWNAVSLASNRAAL